MLKRLIQQLVSDWQAWFGHWVSGDGCLHLLDLMATSVFAVTGAYAVMAYARNNKSRIDALGIFAGSLCTAIGGGSIRALLVLQRPLLLDQPDYLVAILVGYVLAITHQPGIHRHQTWWVTLDAMSAGLFAAIGAQTADALNLAAYMQVGFAALTAAGGGCLRDVLIIRTTPGCFSHEFYASSASLAGLTYVLLHRLTHWELGWVMAVTTVVGFTCRMTTYALDLHLPYIDGRGRWQWQALELRPRLAASWRNTKQHKAQFHIQMTYLIQRLKARGGR